MGVPLVAMLQWASVPLVALHTTGHGTVIWPDNIDFCPDTLCLENIRLKKLKRKIDALSEISYSVHAYTADPRWI